MRKKPVCSICGHGDAYPWGPSCGGRHSDDYENAIAFERIQKTLASPSFGERVIDAITKQQQLILDLAALVRRMSYQIKRDGSNDNLVQQSIEFLKKNNLDGEILRTKE